MWRTNCEQLAAFDETVTSKEEEIASLKEQLRNQFSPSLSLNESGGEEDDAHVPRALQEWNLLSKEMLSDFNTAVKALRERLDPESKVLAGQDFQHTSQRESELVADYIRRLEGTFQIAYGADQMSTETREAIQDGLCWELMRSPNVSGALFYKELCVSAKHEENRQSELKKSQQYQKQEWPCKHHNL